MAMGTMKNDGYYMVTDVILCVGICISMIMIHERMIFGCLV